MTNRYVRSLVSIEQIEETVDWLGATGTPRLAAVWRDVMLGMLGGAMLESDLDALVRTRTTEFAEQTMLSAHERETLAAAVRTACLLVVAVEDAPSSLVIDDDRLALPPVDNAEA